MSADPGPERGRSPNRPPWLATALAVGLVALLGSVLLTAPGESEPGDPDRHRSAPPVDRDDRASGPERPTDRFDGRPGTRVEQAEDGPLLGVSVGATVISTDFDGRITAVELDAGSITRTAIRTGSFVTVDQTLVVHTGCGAWRIVELPAFTLGDELIGCGSYKPIAQRGADVSLFQRTDPSGRPEVLVATGDGMVTDLDQTGVDPSAYGTVSAGRVLVEVASGDLVWVRASDGSSTHYATGRLIAAEPAGVLWASCPADAGCDVWFGTPRQPKVHRFPFLDDGDGELQARMNRTASRAVFFLPDDTLRILSLETGHAREVRNPGIHWSTASWSPDGLWLLGPTGREVAALNTLNGRSVRFDGVPGDVSPGWLAVVGSD